MPFVNDSDSSFDAFYAARTPRSIYCFLDIDCYYQKRKMGSRPQSRDETSFPAGNTTSSSCTSERLGAFGALQLDYPTDYSSQRRTMTEYPHVSRPTELRNMEPSVANDERYDPHLSAGTRGSAGSTRVQHQGETPLLRQPYMSSYPSN
ncbi:hypothetical protein OSTOST_21386, partial [Ostertagia ostertagi]